MLQETVTSPTAPAPAGPYSPAVVWNNLVFISGQGPIDPRTGSFDATNIAAQTAQVLANLETLLEAAGSSRRQVLKVQVYLTNIEDFSEMNGVYREFFEGCVLPARTTIQAGALPGGVGVEIDAIAFRTIAQAKIGD